jgi:hypothetical protein
MNNIQSQANDTMQLYLAGGMALGFILFVIICALVYSVMKTADEAGKIRQILERMETEKKTQTVLNDN